MLPHSNKCNDDIFNKTLLKPNKRYKLPFPKQLLKRQIQRTFRKSALNFCAVGVFFLCLFIFYKLIDYVKINNETGNPFFQPMLGHLNFDDPSEHWNISFQFNMPDVEGDRKDWHDYAAIFADGKRIGPGEQGKPTINTDETKKELEKQLKFENGFNALLSDMISVNRSVPDIRLRGCLTKRYLAKLPMVSIVIPCRNEYQSVLQRTLHSIVNRTPKELLKEIIIVDDNSSRGYSIKNMIKYADRYFPKLVQFIRLPERRGLMYVRQAGAKIATGDVLVFFDSHIECNYNWLPPLLEPIAFDDRISTTPFIDRINHTTFAYIPTDGWRGSFRWDLTFIMSSLRTGPGIDETKPYKDVIMMGGLFAISRRFFWELGGYDVGMDTWGGEQFELSFKIWMCGGQLLTVPCSHVGHIFIVPIDNKRSPKDFNFLERNKKRVAEVWMDDFKQYLYQSQPEFYKNLDAGNLTEQHAIRKRLKCKSFKWFLEFVAPDVLEDSPIDGPPDFANGTLKSLAFPKLCLDNLNHGIGETVGVYQCASNLKYPHSNQFWNFNFRQEIKNGYTNHCLDVYKPLPDAEVVLFNCHHAGGNQFWYYDRQQQMLIHGSNGTKCLELIPHEKDFKVVANNCNITNIQMKWSFGFVNETLEPSKYYKLT